MINQHEGQYAIETMCAALGVSESGYYAWRKREPSAHEQEDQRILAAIRRIHQDSRQLYGSPRIHAMLQREGIRCSRKRVARLMQEHGIFSRRRPKRRIKTTDSQHDDRLLPTCSSAISAPAHPIRNGWAISWGYGRWQAGFIWPLCWIPFPG